MHIDSTFYFKTQHLETSTELEKGPSSVEQHFYSAALIQAGLLSPALLGLLEERLTLLPVLQERSLRKAEKRGWAAAFFRIELKLERFTEGHVPLCNGLNWIYLARTIGTWVPFLSACQPLKIRCNQKYALSLFLVTCAYNPRPRIYAHLRGFCGVVFTAFVSSDVL